ncbi:MAG: cyclic nucleotide-binding domain-containing protein [Elusimicrobiota bacterium]|jgi:CRP-like cAMP-binding protein
MQPEQLSLDEDFARFLSGVLQLDGFFPEFRAEQISRLFPHSGLYCYPDGHRLIEQGDDGRDLYVVYTGEVCIHRSLGSASAPLARLTSGAIIGEMALLRDGLRVASAVVSGDSSIFRLAYGDLQYILHHNPQLSSHLAALAAKRAQE